MRTLGGEEPTQPGSCFSPKSGQTASNRNFSASGCGTPLALRAPPLINAGGKGAVKICPTNSNFVALISRSHSCKNKNAAHSGSVFISQGYQMARSTLLERRHLVQAYTWQGVPLTTALTRLTLGFQARLERLWEWETLIPKVTPLPQKSHFAIHCTSHPDNYS